MKGKKASLLAYLPRIMFIIYNMSQVLHGVVPKCSWHLLFSQQEGLQHVHHNLPVGINQIIGGLATSGTGDEENW
jgi:hypothetical protein